MTAEDLAFGTVVSHIACESTSFIHLCGIRIIQSAEVSTVAGNSSIKDKFDTGGSGETGIGTVCIVVDGGGTADGERSPEEMVAVDLKVVVFTAVDVGCSGVTDLTGAGNGSGITGSCGIGVTAEEDLAVNGQFAGKIDRVGIDGDIFNNGSALSDNQSGSLFCSAVVTAEDDSAGVIAYHAADTLVGRTSERTGTRSRAVEVDFFSSSADNTVDGDSAGALGSVVQNDVPVGTAVDGVDLLTIVGDSTLFLVERSGVDICQSTVEGPIAFAADLAAQGRLVDNSDIAVNGLVASIEEVVVSTAENGGGVGRVKDGRLGGAVHIDSGSSGSITVEVDISGSGDFCILTGKGTAKGSVDIDCKGIGHGDVRSDFLGSESVEDQSGVCTAENVVSGTFVIGDVTGFFVDGTIPCNNSVEYDIGAAGKNSVSACSEVTADSDAAAGGVTLTGSAEGQLVVGAVVNLLISVEGVFNSTGAEHGGGTGVFPGKVQCSGNDSFAVDSDISNALDSGA